MVQYEIMRWKKSCGGLPSSFIYPLNPSFGYIIGWWADFVVLYQGGQKETPVLMPLPASLFLYTLSMGFSDLN